MGYMYQNACTSTKWSTSLQSTVYQVTMPSIRGNITESRVKVQIRLAVLGKESLAQSTSQTWMPSPNVNKHKDEIEPHDLENQVIDKNPFSFHKKLDCW